MRLRAGALGTALASLLGSAAPVHAVCQPCGAPPPPIVRLTLYPPVAESRPAVQLGWDYADGRPLPLALRLLRAPAGGSLQEVWRCEAPGSSCARDSYRDPGPLTEATRYLYRLEAIYADEIAVSDTVSVTTRPNRPLALSAVARANGSLRLAWQDRSAVEVAYLLRRQSLPDAAADDFHVLLSPGTTEYVDAAYRADRAYEYTLRAIGYETSNGLDRVDSNPVRLPVGGKRVIHGLDELAARTRFKPYGALVREPTPGDVQRPSERVDFRDEWTGAPIMKLTRGPGTEHLDYPNRWVWSRDGSQLLFYSEDGGPGYRVMNADGSGIRFLHGISASPTFYSAWIPKWSRSDARQVLYSDDRGHVGRWNVPGPHGLGGDAGVLFSLPPPVDPYVVLTPHPDGRGALLQTGLQATTACVMRSRGYLLDLENPTHPPQVLELPFVAHDVGLTKDPAYRMHFGYEVNHCAYSEATHHGHFLWDPSQGASERVYDVPMSHLAWSPDGRKAAFLSGGNLVIFDAASRAASTIAFPPTCCGHISWEVDPDSFVVATESQLFRVWVDGHKTLIARPYTPLLFGGDRSVALFPEESRDGTKVAFESAMLGDIDVYAAVMKLPDPPRGLALASDAGGSRLTWSAPLHASEVAAYDVWQSSRSGEGYTLLGTAPAGDGAPLAWALGGTPAGFYVVTAVEHSGLEGLPSNEVAASAGARRLWFEPHLGDVTRPLAPVFDPEASGFYYVEAAAGEGPLGTAAVSIDVPPGAFYVWVRTRGPSGAGVAIFDATSTLGVIPVAGASWGWTRLAAPSPTPVSGGRLRLLPSAFGVALDQVLLTQDPGFVPQGVAVRLQAATAPSAPVSGLRASAESPFRCRLRWDDPRLPGQSHFNVYASDDPATQTWDQQRLVASTVEGEYLDWGLRPGRQVRYRVTTMDRLGQEGAGAVAVCMTPALTPVRVLIRPQGTEGVLAPDPVTGVWSFGFEIPNVPAPSGYVAWLRVHSTDGRAPVQYLWRSLDGQAPQLSPSLTRTRDAGGPLVDGNPDPETGIWLALPLGDPIASFEGHPLAPGRHVVALWPSARTLVPNLRITAFVVSNDLGFRPDGYTSLLFPDAAPSEPPDGPACGLGFELALLLSPLQRLRRRQRRG